MSENAKQPDPFTPSVEQQRDSLTRELVNLVETGQRLRLQKLAIDRNLEVIRLQHAAITSEITCLLSDKHETPTQE